MTKQKEIRKTAEPRIVQAEDDGTFLGIASVMEVQDNQGEVIAKGAFAKTLKDRGSGRVLKYEHTMHPIGTIELQVDGNKLLAKGKFDLTLLPGGSPVNPEAQRIYSIMRSGGIPSPFSLSIGGRIVKSEGRYGGQVRITEVNLREVSIVDAPANNETKIILFKNDEPVQKPSGHSVKPSGHSVDHLQKIYETIKKINRGEI